MNRTARNGISIALVLGALLVAAAGIAIWRGRGPGAGATSAEAAVVWRCPMHPQIVADRPGPCPVCGMDLVPSPAAGSTGAEASPAEAAPSDVPGQGVVRLTLERRQRIGVRTALVARGPFTRTVRAVGRVTYDETRLHHVHTKVDGYVERLYANATGEVVRRGEPLLEIYSPELLASQQEYLVALDARDRTARSSLDSVAGFGHDLVESARRRLELFDVSAAQIAELEATRRPRRTLPVLAEVGGVVTVRNVTQGQRVDAGTTLLDVADLSRVWVLASIYEYELPYVHAGQRATMRLSYLPGETLSGTVALVYPTIEAATRTAQVRIEFDNPRLLLKPDMYAEVELAASLGDRLAVPESAILETGTRSLAFVEREPGVFEPREVRLGARLSDAFEVLSGLEEGERVVVSGNFLLDSESKLKAAFQATVESDPHAGHGRTP